MQTKAKTKGLFLGLGILIGMLVAFGVVWLDLESLKDNTVKEVSKLFQTKDKPAKTKTDTIVVVEKGQHNMDLGEEYAPDTTTFLDSLPLPTDSTLIRKDELLYVKNIKVIRLTATGSAVDTAIAQAANVEPEGIPANYSVEFWKSPINYRGYKLGKGKLVLFGIYQTDDISLVSLGNALFLKNRDYYFKLEPGEEFVTLTAVNDRNLLAKLNQ